MRRRPWSDTKASARPARSASTRRASTRRIWNARLPDPSFVDFAGVSVTYGAGTKQAVAALSPTALTFGQGEFVCIGGPSGGGKTTLMQTLAGFLPPTTGTVSVGGAVVTGPGPERGVVFQQAALFPWKTVAAN